jgi:hypothetical protein
VVLSWCREVRYQEGLAPGRWECCVLTVSLTVGAKVHTGQRTACIDSAACISIAAASVLLPGTA